MIDNNSLPVPKLDGRDSNLITAQALELAHHYLPGWQAGPGDPARRMLDIFVRLMEILIQRLNKIPEKHFLSFLDMVNVEQKTGNPAEVPVTFLPAKSAPGGGHIPGGTRVATTQTDSTNAHVFETRSSFHATTAKLVKTIDVIPRTDKYKDLDPLPLPPEPQDIENQSGAVTALSPDAQDHEDIPHVLYIASQTLFGGNEKVILDLTLTLAGGDAGIFNSGNLKWRVYDKDKKKWSDNPLDANYSLESLPGTKKIRLSPFSGTAKSEVDGKEDFWIACFFYRQFSEESPIPGIKEIEGELLSIPPTGAGSPENSFAAKIDAAFANHTPVDPSAPIYPFGQRPQYGDTFYIASKQAFAPDVDTVTLVFTVYRYNDDEIIKRFQNMKNGTEEKITSGVQWQYMDNSGTWKTLSYFEHTLTVTRNSDSTFNKIAHAAVKFEEGVEVSNAHDEDGTLIPLEPGTSDTAKVILSGFNDIGLNVIDKEENYWIRAVVKRFTSYGKDAWVIPPTDPVNDPYIIIGPTFIPPIIENIDITYSRSPERIPVDAIHTENNFEFTLHKETRDSLTYGLPPFIPFESHPVGGNTRFFSQQPALYMGFDRDFGDVYISMFFHIDELRAETGYALEQGNPHIVWEYAADGYIWRPLDVTDNTADLTAAGTLAFTGPGDALKLTLFNHSLYWYRARLAEGAYYYPPIIKAIYLNTVMADNHTVLHEDIVIGSGNGQAGQQIKLVRTPVSGAQLWVREAEKPGEKDQLEDELITDDKDVGHDMGSPKTGVRVQWLRVSNFFSSGPRSRHYTLDAVNGIVTFGNGKNGMIPPAGKDNIIMTNYRTGGGEDANRDASPLAVKELKSSLPYIDKVFNIQYGVGGSNSWSMEDAKRFGPQSLKHRGRAVTTEDYEWMVLQNFSQVARAKCIPTRIPASGGSLVFTPGAATVIVVPKSSQSDPKKPQPSKGLLKNIRQLLAQNALGSIFQDIHVIGPGFEQIDINACVIPHTPGESSLVERRIIKNLEEFFHPLTGGEKKQGWPFGRNVYISEVYAVIERTDGVRFVEDAQFTGRPGQDFIEIGENSLGYSGSHSINMITRETD